MKTQILTGQKIKELSISFVGGAAVGYIIYVLRDVPNAPYVCSVGAVGFTFLKDYVKDKAFVQRFINSFGE